MIAVTTDRIIAQVADSLAEAMEVTTEAEVVADNDPKKTYTNLAHRVLFRLAGKKLTVLPEKAVKQLIGVGTLANAAQRIFNIFTDALIANEDQHFILRRKGSTFEVIVMSPTGVQAFFTGVSMQDACAQTAQVLNLNGGTVTGVDA